MKKDIIISTFCFGTLTSVAIGAATGSIFLSMASSIAIWSICAAIDLAADRIVEAIKNKP